MGLHDLVQVELVELGLLRRVDDPSVVVSGRIISQDVFSAGESEFSEEKRDAHFSTVIPEGANAYVIGALGGLGSGHKGTRITFYCVAFA